MKKIICMFLLLTMSIGLTACVDNMGIDFFGILPVTVATQEYDGEYDIEIKLLEHYDDERYKESFLMTYEEYVDFCQEQNINQKYQDDDKKYIVYQMSKYNADLYVVDVIEHKAEATLYITTTEQLYEKRDGSRLTTVIIPVSDEIEKISVQKIATQNELDYTSRSLTIMEFSDKENQQLAESLYIETNNKEVDKIFNRMLSETMKQTTVEKEYRKEYFGLQNDVYEGSIKFSIENSISETPDGEYQNYNTRFKSDTMCNFYKDNKGKYEKDCRAGNRQYLLLDMLDIAIISSNPVISTPENEKAETFKIESSMEETNSHYILKITLELLEDSKMRFEDSIYVDKDSYLVEKILTTTTTLEYNDGKYIDTREIYAEEEQKFEYTDENVTIPKKVINEAHIAFPLSM